MYKNKKTSFVLIGIALTFALAACGSSEKLITDTGSGSYKEIDKKEYLDVAALNQPKEEGASGNYKVYTLEKGTFTEKALNQTLNRAYINVPTVKLDVEEGTVQLKEYASGSMFDYIEEGEPIAILQTEVDELPIEEAELKLTRLQERYQRAELKLAEDLEELRVDRTLIYNDYERFVIDVRCKQLQLDWEKAKRNFEREIANTTERLDVLKASRDATEVIAPVSGYVVYTNKYTPGTDLKNGAYICNILTSDEFYVQTTNQADQFTYGMNVKFRNVADLVDGFVISAGSRALYGNLDTGKATFAVEFGEDMPASTKIQIRSLVMEGNLKTIENVILVPRQAVTEDGDSYFVTVLKEDGSLLKTEFIPGGNNPEQYWVYEGLAEGMQIVY